jgi:hypothetical protein
MEMDGIEIVERREDDYPIAVIDSRGEIANNILYLRLIIPPNPLVPEGEIFTFSLN